MTLHTTGALLGRLGELYDAGLARGDSTGWKSVDELYTVAPGLVTVITGWPGSGKSEWTDALASNLIDQGWRFVWYSPENFPVEVHLSKLIEKRAGKPFGRGPTDRISRDEVQAIAMALHGRIAFIDCGDEALDIGQILGESWKMLSMVRKTERRALVIDPWNEVRHLRENGETETDYISQALGFVRRWARTHNIHVFIVAHPAKQPRDNGKLPIPKPDMIAGSQHWWNKADQCIAVYRDYSDTQEVQIHVQKVRFKHHGRIGMATLTYDRVTGRYHEPLRDAEGRIYEFSYGNKA